MQITNVPGVSPANGRLRHHPDWHPSSRESQCMRCGLLISSCWAHNDGRQLLCGTCYHVARWQWVKRCRALRRAARAGSKR